MTNGTNMSRASGLNADRVSQAALARPSGLAHLVATQADQTGQSALARPSGMQPGSDRTSQAAIVRPSAKVKPSDRPSQAANVRPSGPSGFLVPERASQFSRSSRTSRSERPPRYTDRPSQYKRRSQTGDRWTVRSIRSSVSWSHHTLWASQNLIQNSLTSDLYGDEFGYEPKPIVPKT